VVCLGTATTVVGSLAPRYETADDIPKTVIKQKLTLNVEMEKVIDGDTVRVSHIPSLFSVGRKAAHTKRKLSDSTIIVRLYGVDAPETAKYRGQEGQPFGEEAKTYVLDKVGDTHRKVKLKLLSKDRYRRVLGKITYKGGLLGLQDKDLSEELLKQGLATVYRQGGAVYDGNRRELELLEARARQQKRGMWRNVDEVSFQTPAEYKAGLRQKAAKREFAK
jgi:endonuclease YncB( thermonuclease family)